MTQSSFSRPLLAERKRRECICQPARLCCASCTGATCNGAIGQHTEHTCLLVAHMFAAGHLPRAELSRQAQEAEAHLADVCVLKCREPTSLSTALLCHLHRAFVRNSTICQHA